MHTIRVGVAMLTAVALAGCYPAPTQKESAVTGTVVSDRLPVIGAEVTLVRKTEGEEATETDSLGQFVFVGERGWTVNWLIRLGSLDCAIDWMLNVDRDDGRSRRIAVLGLGPCSPPERIRIICDFANEAEFCEILEPPWLNRSVREVADEVQSRENGQ